MSLYESYTDEIHDQLGYYAHWMPSDLPLKLGDYGTLEGNRFHRLGNIREISKLKIGTINKPAGNFWHMSQRGVNLDSSFSGSYSNVRGEVKVNFNGQHKVFMKLEECNAMTIKNMDDLETCVTNVYRRPGNDWMLKYVIVTSRIISRRNLIAVSQRSNTWLSFYGNYSLGSENRGNNILGTMGLRKQSGGISLFFNDAGLLQTPLFKLQQLKDPITKKAHMAAVI